MFLDIKRKIILFSLKRRCQNCYFQLSDADIMIGWLPFILKRKFILKNKNILKNKDILPIKSSDKKIISEKDSLSIYNKVFIKKFSCKKNYKQARVIVINMECNKCGYLYSYDLDIDKLSGNDFENDLWI